MNEQHTDADETRLRELLVRSRPAPSLPPRFQDGVWRRIEDGEAPSQSAGSLGWLDTLAVWVMRPRLAFAIAAMVMLAGVLFGAHEGTQVARQDAQARYLAMVAPNSLR